MIVLLRSSNPIRVLTDGVEKMVHQRPIALSRPSRKLPPPPPSPPVEAYLPRERKGSTVRVMTAQKRNEKAISLVPTGELYFSVGKLFCPPPPRSPAAASQPEEHICSRSINHRKPAPVVPK